jgi:hypothetical protein
VDGPGFRDVVLRSPDDPGRLRWEDAGGPLRDRQPGNRALSESAARLADRLGQALDGFGPDRIVSRLQDLEDRVAERLHFAAVRVESVADARLLPGASSGRGRGSPAEEIPRSQLFSRLAAADGGAEAVQAAQDDRESLLSDLGTGAVMVAFLRRWPTGSG